MLLKIKKQILQAHKHKLYLIFLLKKKNSGLINYQELIKTLKGEQTPERRAIF